MVVVVETNFSVQLSPKLNNIIQIRSFNPTAFWKGASLTSAPLRLTLPKQTKGRDVLWVPNSICKKNF